MNTIRNFIRGYVTLVGEVPALLAGLVTVWVLVAVVFTVMISIEFPFIPVIILGWCSPVAPAACMYGLGRLIRWLARQQS